MPEIEVNLLSFHYGDLLDKDIKVAVVIAIINGPPFNTFTSDSNLLVI